MYLEIFLADFAVFRVFWGISRDFAGFPEFRRSATAQNIRSPVYEYQVNKIFSALSIIFIQTLNFLDHSLPFFLVPDDLQVVLLVSEMMILVVVSKSVQLTSEAMSSRPLTCLSFSCLIKSFISGSSSSSFSWPVQMVALIAEAW